MGLRFHRHPRIGRSETTRQFEIQVGDSWQGDRASVQVGARLIADDPGTRAIPLDANAWGQPTVAHSDKPATVAVSWGVTTDGQAETVGPDVFHLLEWSGYVADGTYSAGLTRFEYTDAEGHVVQVPSGIASAFELPDGVTWRTETTSEAVTWLDGERVPMWAAIQHFEPVQEANTRLHDQRAGSKPRRSDAITYRT